MLKLILLPLLLVTPNHQETDGKLLMLRMVLTEIAIKYKI